MISAITPGRSMPGEAFFNSFYPFILAACVGIFFGLRHYFKGARCSSIENVSGKTAIITGGSSGIGLELTRSLSSAGVKVIMACRDKNKAKRAIKDIERDCPNAQVKFIKIDLASFASVRRFVAEFKSSESRLDILINNAGIMHQSEAATIDGNETQFQVNYLGHFLLTYLLLDLLKATPGSRVVNNTAHAYKLAEFSLDGLVNLPSTDLNANVRSTGCNGNIPESSDKSAGETEDAGGRLSNGHVSNVSAKGGDLPVNAGPPNAEPVTSAVAYAQSKLALILLTRKLASRFDSSPSVFVANPGVVRTDLYENMSFKKNPVLAFMLAPFLWFFMKAPSDGAQTALYCATSPNLKSGEYYSECSVSRLETNALDDKKMDLLWLSSLKICSL